MPWASGDAGMAGQLLGWWPGDLGSTGMMLVGLGLLIAILLRRSFRYYGRRGSRKAGAEPLLATTTPPAGPYRSLTNPPAEVLRWQVEMHEIARDLRAEMDSKLRLLQLLIAQAQQQADRLERLLNEKRGQDSFSGNDS